MDRKQIEVVAGAIVSAGRLFATERGYDDLGKNTPPYAGSRRTSKYSTH